jgi:hypothetical protein
VLQAGLVPAVAVAEAEVEQALPDRGGDRGADRRVGGHGPERGGLGVGHPEIAFAVGRQPRRLGEERRRERAVA